MRGGGASGCDKDEGCSVDVNHSSAVIDGSGSSSGRPVGAGGKGIGSDSGLLDDIRSWLATDNELLESTSAEVGRGATVATEGGDESSPPSS